MPSNIDRIPSSAFEADALLGTIERYRIDRDTRLERDATGDVVLRYRGVRLARYAVNGDVHIESAYRDTLHVTRGCAERLNRLCPPGWEFRRRLRAYAGTDGRRRNPFERFTGRMPGDFWYGEYRLTLEEPLVFAANGDIGYSRYSDELVPLSAVRASNYERLNMENPLPAPRPRVNWGVGRPAHRATSVGLEPAPETPPRHVTAGRYLGWLGCTCTACHDTREAARTRYWQPVSPPPAPAIEFDPSFDPAPVLPSRRIIVRYTSDGAMTTDWTEAPLVTTEA